MSFRTSVAFRGIADTVRSHILVKCQVLPSDVHWRPTKDFGHPPASGVKVV